MTNFDEARTARGLRPVRWHFDDGATYDGFTNDSRWNGFLNIWVTPDVLSLVIDKEITSDDDEETRADLRAQQMDASTGLVSLAFGFATHEA